MPFGKVGSPSVTNLPVFGKVLECMENTVTWTDRFNKQAKQSTYIPNSGKLKAFLGALGSKVWDTFIRHWKAMQEKSGLLKREPTTDHEDILPFATSLHRQDEGVGYPRNDMEATPGAARKSKAQGPEHTGQLLSM